MKSNAVQVTSTFHSILSIPGECNSLMYCLVTYISLNRFQRLRIWSQFCTCLETNTQIQRITYCVEWSIIHVNLLCEHIRVSARFSVRIFQLSYSSSGFLAVFFYQYSFRHCIKFILLVSLNVFSRHCIF